MSSGSGNRGRPRMETTKLSLLGVVFVVAGLLGWVVTFSFYSHLPPFTLLNSVVLWIIAVVCVIAAIVISRRIANEEIGLDRSQLSPLTVTNWMMTGRAAAVIGALFAGLYVGVGVYVVPLSGRVLAAQDDLLGVLASALGGVAAAGAGLYLERSCLAPPSGGADGRNPVGA